MEDLTFNDKVTFRAGRGKSEGTIANITQDMVTIRTAKGNMVNRKRSAVAKVTTVVLTPPVTVSYNGVDLGEVQPLHDRNGTKLNVGDIVMVPMVVKNLAPQDDYCNCHLESVHGRRPDGAKENVHAMNTGVIVLHERPGLLP